MCSGCVFTASVLVYTDYARGADSVPLAVKYLFDFLDYEAHNVGMTDPDVVHVWKNNRYSINQHCH